MLSREEEPTSFCLHLVIIGGGLAGLSAAISTCLAGHAVTILEKAPELHEAGAGLQITPNASRLFRTWGIYEELENKAAAPTTLSVHRFDGTQLLAREDRFQEKILEAYGAPFWDLHRVDLQRAMVARAIQLGVKIKLSAAVVSVDFDKTAVTLESGETIGGDIILGADGLWSLSRDKFLGRPSPPRLTGDLAYRIVLDLEDISDIELRAWISNPTVNFWIGPDAHAVAYSVAAGKMYNVVLLCPDDLPEDVSKAEGNVNEMMARFKSWDPILTKFLSHVKKVDKWRLMHLSELEAWKNSKGTFVMAGDSCHPMLPYLAQGANSSLEDGAVLGRLLGRVKDEESIPTAISLYETLRKRRGEAIAQETFRQRESFHMLDGPEQDERDLLFLAHLGKAPSRNFPSRWTCPTVQPWLYGYDAYAEADKVFVKHPF